MLFTRCDAALVRRFLQILIRPLAERRMFFKPNYCCNCGEKIIREEWRVLTSRRFCGVCAVENQGHEWAVRSIIAGSLLVGIFGFGSYLRTPEQSQHTPARTGSVHVPSAGRTADISPAGLKPMEEVGPELAGREQLAQQPPAGRAPHEGSKEQLRPLSGASDHPAYFCGAMTKKGKPCSRRVKTKGRCWQHAGQPSALETQPAPDMY